MRWGKIVDINHVFFFFTTVPLIPPPPNYIIIIVITQVSPCSSTATLTQIANIIVQLFVCWNNTLLGWIQGCFVCCLDPLYEGGTVIPDCVTDCVTVIPDCGPALNIAEMFHIMSQWMSRFDQTRVVSSAPLLAELWGVLLHNGFVYLQEQSELERASSELDRPFAV